MKKFLAFVSVLLFTATAFAMDDIDSQWNAFVKPLSRLHQLDVQSVMQLMDEEDCREVMNSVHSADIPSRVYALIENKYILLKSFHWTDDFSPIIKAILLLPAEQTREVAAVLRKYEDQVLMSEANRLVIALALEFPAAALDSSFVDILRCMPRLLRVVPDESPWRLHVALQLLLCELNMFPRESSSLELSEFPPAVLERKKKYNLNLRGVQNDQQFARCFLPLEQTTWFPADMPDDERSRAYQRVLQMSREELVELSRCVPWLFVKGVSVENQTWSLQDALQHLIKTERHVVIPRKVSARSLPADLHRKKDTENLRVQALLREAKERATHAALRERLDGYEQP